MKKIAIFWIVALFPLVAAAANLEKLTIQTPEKQLHFQVEIAQTPQEQERGLMERETLKADQGMLFVMPMERVIRMWMKNTPLSLDMLFINAKGEIIYVAPKTTPNSRKIITTRKPALAVLELLGGEAEKNNIRAGDRVIHEAFKP